MRTITLVTGGGRSGKSTYALECAGSYARKAFIATAVAFDDELRERISRHKQERDSSYATIEEPLDLARAIASVPHEAEVAVIDCLSVWVGNWMHENEPGMNDAVDLLIDALENPPCDIIIVTNEVGMGIIPDNAMSRRYRDILGMVNQRVARKADRVVLLVSGLPVSIKGI